MLKSASNPRSATAMRNAADACVILNEVAAEPAARPVARSNWTQGVDMRSTALASRVNAPVGKSAITMSRRDCACAKSRICGNVFMVYGPNATDRYRGVQKNGAWPNFGSRAEVTVWVEQGAEPATDGVARFRRRGFVRAHSTPESRSCGGGVFQNRLSRPGPRFAQRVPGRLAERNLAPEARGVGRVVWHGFGPSPARAHGHR